MYKHCHLFTEIKWKQQFHDQVKLNVITYNKVIKINSKTSLLSEDNYG